METNQAHRPRDDGWQIVERYEYEPYGKVAIKDGIGNALAESQIENSFYFTGAMHDSETGLYNLRNRYYNPELGRFMTRDPLGYITPSPLVGEGWGEGLKSNMNLYSYVLNNPINKIDPFGLREDHEVLQPEDWRARSSDVWNISQYGPNSPSWYPYVEGAIVGGPAVALMGVGAINVAIPYATATATFLSSIATEIAKAGVIGYTLTHPENISDFAEGVISGFVSEYGKHVTGLPSQSIFSVAGEYVVGAPLGAVTREVVDAISIYSESDKEHPKKVE